MAKQVCDIKSTKGIAAADSREQTRSWTEKQVAWYKYYYNMYNEIRRYEREHGETIWNKLSAADRVKDEVSSLKRLLPTFDMAIRILKNKFDYAGHDLSFSMEEVEPIW